MPLPGAGHRWSSAICLLLFRVESCVVKIFTKRLGRSHVAVKRQEPATEQSQRQNAALVRRGASLKKISCEMQK